MGMLSNRIFYFFYVSQSFFFYDFFNVYLFFKIIQLITVCTVCTGPASTKVAWFITMQIFKMWKNKLQAKNMDFEVQYWDSQWDENFISFISPSFPWAVQWRIKLQSSRSKCCIINHSHSHECRLGQRPISGPKENENQSHMCPSLLCKDTHTQSLTACNSSPVC